MTLSDRFREEGIEKCIEKVAKEILRKGADIDFVIRVTKLPKERILELKKEAEMKNRSNKNFTATG